MARETIRERLRKGLRRELWVTLGPALVLVVAAFVIAWRFVEPAPPSSILIALGPDEAGARYFATRYRDELAKHGVTLKIRERADQKTVVHDVADADSAIDIAFVQSGMPVGEDGATLLSLGSVAYSPLWVFYRGETLTDLGGLAGRRIAIGPENSGTNALARTLLAANQADGAGTTLLAMERQEAAAALADGTVDAVILVCPAEAPAVKALVVAEGVKLLSFERAEAYTRRFPYLTRLVLPRGVFDLARDLPAADVVLISPTTNLIASTYLHPALAYLLLRTAADVHGSAGLLDRAGEFPTPLESGFPLSDEAKRFYKSGSPLLQRYLPFWLANLIDRLWVMLVPLIAVILPLLRAVPPLMAWRARSRIYRFYAELKEVELQLESAPPPRLEALLERLDRLEAVVNQLPTPVAYAENLYSFRHHIDIVRMRIVRRLAEPHGEAPAQVGPVVEAA
jgi:hypothetical protein